MPVLRQKTNQEKLAIYKNFFLGNTSCYGSYDPLTGRFFHIDRPVTIETIISHLKGVQPYAVYQLVKNRTRSVVVDFDSHDKELPLNFYHQAKHYGVPVYTEISKSKGYHQWMFFYGENGVRADKARTVVRHILEDIDSPTNIEIFPKQDSAGGKGSGIKYGNAINAPLYGLSVPEGKTVFVDPLDFKIRDSQWEILDHAELVTEQDLDDLIAMNDWEVGQAGLDSITGISQQVNINHKGQNYRAWVPCTEKMLFGVGQYQRLTAFRLAVHLKNYGVNYMTAVDILKSWAKLNRPKNGKQIIREEEIISQVKYGYKNKYTSYGCGEPETLPFCTPDCPLYAKTMRQ